MDHIARYDRLQRIVAEAAQYRTLREVVKSDPQITPHTAALLRTAFNVDTDDLINEGARLMFHFYFVEDWAQQHGIVLCRITEYATPETLVAV